MKDLLIGIEDKFYERKKKLVPLNKICAARVNYFFLYKIMKKNNGFLYQIDVFYMHWLACCSRL